MSNSCSGFNMWPYATVCIHMCTNMYTLLQTKELRRRMRTHGDPTDVLILVTFIAMACYRSPILFVNNIS